MSRPRARAAAITFAIAALTVIGALPSAAAASSGTAMLRAINSARTHRGLPAVRRAGSLAHSSQLYARVLARRSIFRHATRPHAAGFGRVAEILGLAPRGCGNRAVVRAWLHSPVHRHILLSRSYRYAGLGVARGRMGRFWVVRFGNR